MNVVITGVSRGIGLELTRIALAAGHDLLGVARDPDNSPELTALSREFGPRLRLVAADLRAPLAAGAIAAAAGPWDAVDLLVNNAGILCRGAAREEFMESYLVNAVAPFEVTQALLPRLRKSTDPRVIHITSKMGSIADNSSGGYYAYRASKSALNMINASLVRDNDWLTAIVIHPGWVRTSMGGPEAPTPVMESAAGIWRVVSGLKRASSGRFFDFHGHPLPW